jgi:hypothetical protein
LEVIALSLTAEALSIDSENRLFSKLNSDYKTDFPLALITSRLKYAGCPGKAHLIGKTDYEHAPSRGYCASQDCYYYMCLCAAIKRLSTAMLSVQKIKEKSGNAVLSIERPVYAVEKLRQRCGRYFHPRIG